MLEYIDSSLSDLGWKSNVNLDLWRCLVRLNKFSNSSDFGFNIYKKMYLEFSQGLNLILP